MSYIFMILFTALPREQRLARNHYKAPQVTDTTNQDLKDLYRECHFSPLQSSHLRGKRRFLPLLLGKVLQHGTLHLHRGRRKR